MNDPDRVEFLIKNMKPDNLENTIFAIVLDFTKPWTFMDQLSQWSDVIFEVNKKLFLQLPFAKQNQMKKKIEEHFKLYKNPNKSTENKDAVDVTSEETKTNNETAEDDMKEALKLMDLEEGVLNVNLGVQIMIIWTKSEVVATGETMKYFQSRFEFILKHLREFALRYGASLVFTSWKKGTNMELLYSYLKHIIFEADFLMGPEVNNKESIFIPSGYDSPKLISLLVPNIDDPYDRIVINVSSGETVDVEEEIDWPDFYTDLDSTNFKRSEKANTNEDVIAAAKNRVVNTNTFFQNLRSRGNDIKKKDEDTKKEGTTKPSIEEFKKKLMLRDIDTNNDNSTE